MKKQIIAAVMMVLTVSGIAEAKSISQNVELSVTEKGFEPNSIDVKPGSDVVLKVTRKTDSTCAKQVQVPSKNTKMDLPLNKVVSISLGKLEKGEIRFGCGMNMMEAGRILVH
jgi:plastocyanin domain-containing protein